MISKIRCSLPVGFLRAQPPGDGGGEHPGWVGVLGLPRHILSAAAAGGGHGGCLQAGAGPAPPERGGRVSRPRDSLAAGLSISALCATFFPAQEGSRKRGVPVRSGKMWESATECTKCDMLRPGSKAGAQARNGVRTVAPAGPPCPPSRQARVELAWWIRGRSRVSREARSRTPRPAGGAPGGERRRGAGSVQTAGAEPSGRGVSLLSSLGASTAGFAQWSDAFGRGTEQNGCSRDLPWGSARHYPVSAALRSAVAEWNGRVGGSLGGGHRSG